MALATQNPVEQEGTYPLPEAQLDRFLLKVLIDYPSQADEARMVAAVSQGRTAADFDLSQVKQVLADGDIVAMQRGTAQVTLDDAVVQYAVRIAAATRKWRSEEHTSELQSLMRISYAVFCLKKK